MRFVDLKMVMWLSARYSVSKWYLVVFYISVNCGPYISFGVVVSVFLNIPLAFSWGIGIFHPDTCHPLCFVVILKLFQNLQFRIIQQWPNNSNSCGSMDRRTYPLCQITFAIKKYWCELNLELNLGVRKDEDSRLTRRGLLRIPGHKKRLEVVTRLYVE